MQPPPHFSHFPPNVPALSSSTSSKPLQGQGVLYSSLKEVKLKDENNKEFYRYWSSSDDNLWSEILQENYAQFRKESEIEKQMQQTKNDAKKQEEEKPTIESHFQFQKTDMQNPLWKDWLISDPGEWNFFYLRTA